jgi:hypothetical protein
MTRQPPQESLAEFEYHVYVLEGDSLLEMDRCSGEAYALELLQVVNERGATGWVMYRGRSIAHCRDGQLKGEP